MDRGKVSTTWCDTGLMFCAYKYGVCVSEDSFHSTLKKMKIPIGQWPKFLNSMHADATAHFFNETENNQRCVVVCIKPRDDISGIQIASLLIHEAVHIWQEHCRNIGEQYPSDEMMAYAIQSIAQNLMFAYAEITS